MANHPNRSKVQARMETFKGRGVFQGMYWPYDIYHREGRILAFLGDEKLPRFDYDSENSLRETIEHLAKVARS